MSTEEKAIVIHSALRCALSLHLKLRGSRIGGRGSLRDALANIRSSLGRRLDFIRLPPKATLWLPMALLGAMATGIWLEFRCIYPPPPPSKPLILGLAPEVYGMIQPLNDMRDNECRRMINSTVRRQGDVWIIDGHEFSDVTLAAHWI